MVKEEPHFGEEGFSEFVRKKKKDDVEEDDKVG